MCFRSVPLSSRHVSLFTFVIAGVFAAALGWTSPVLAAGSGRTMALRSTNASARPQTSKPLPSAAMGNIAVPPAPRVLYPPEHCTINFYVATNGADSNDGSLDKPFATLERARDTIRALQAAGGLPKGGVTVWLRGGIYHRAHTFLLTRQDSGTAEAPIVYRGYPHESVELLGGKKITGFHAVTNPSVLDRIQPAYRQKVLEANLKAQGITSFGKIKPQGFGGPMEPTEAELFFRNKPMTLARWPNHGWARIACVPDGSNGSTVGYAGGEPSHWVNEHNVWLHGFWRWNWADSYVKVQSIDAKRHVFVTAKPYGVYGYRKGQRYYAFNILWELDHPGEYYLDRKAGKLYFWPPARLAAGSTAYLSMLKEPFVKMEHTSYVTLRNLNFEFARGSGVQIIGGQRCQVAGCTFRGLGEVAVCIGNDINICNNIYNNTVLDTDSGAANGVLGCNIHDTGEGGIILGGGDRRTLQPGGNYAINNLIHNSNRIVYSYRPAIFVSGVGNCLAHNLIYNLPHSAIILYGDNQLIEYNVIHHVCQETDDCGAFYMGRDWTSQGNVIRYNFFYDIHGVGHDARAVYLDDLTSGATVYGNIFAKTQYGVFIGGGRDNTVVNNVFVNCTPAVYVDARGTSWARPAVYGVMKKRLDVVRAFRPPYSVRYPKLLELKKYYAATGGVPPADNLIERNIAIGGKWLRPVHGTPAMAARAITIRDNLVGIDPQFVDAPRLDFRLKRTSPAFRLGFKPIPVDRIGLYRDQYRSHLPTQR